MLSKENRLTKKDNFSRIHQKGRFFRDEYLALKVAPGKSEITRVGFLVGLKISKKAVVRNKIKRTLREIFRLKVKNCKLKKGFEIIVLVRPEIIERSYKEIESSIDNTLREAGLLI